MAYPLNAAYWNSVCDNTKSSVLERNAAVYKRSEHIKLLKKWGGPLKGKKILKTDLYEEAFGCDHFLYWLLKQNTHVFGMDISYKIGYRAMLRAVKFNKTFNNCISSDVINCAYKDKSFDLIISNSTLDNLIASDAPRAMKELHRILKPSGTLILTLDNRHNPLYVLGYYIEKLLNTNKYYQSKCYSVKEALRLAEQNNFVVQDITAIVHIPTPFNKIALLLGKTNNRVIKRVIRRFVSLFSGLGKKKTKFLTGWFIALKLERN